MKDPALNGAFARLRAGDKSALAEIYTSLRVPVYTVALRILRERSAAEDVTQEVFLKLLDAPPDASVRDPRSWIFRVTRNCAVDAWRRTHTVPLDEQAETAGEDETAQTLLKLDLRSAMSLLPADQREILAMHLNAGLTFRVIAGILGLSVPNTYRKYRDAIRRLQSMLRA